MGGEQGAICAPSRAMIMTGRTLFSLEGDAGEIPDTDTTLPMFLRQHGYYTFATGKWHISGNSLHHSFDSISKVFLGGMHTIKAGGHHQPVLFNYDPSGQYPSSAAWQGNKFASEYFGDATADFILSRKSQQPFFCYVAFSSPHDPRTPPKKYAGRYDPAEVPLPLNFMPQHPFDNGELKIRDEQLLPVPRDTAAIKKEIADYYAMVSAMDAQIGRILDAPEKQGR